jgi:hypothetical protein
MSFGSADNNKGLHLPFPVQGTVLGGKPADEASKSVAERLGLVLAER